HGTPSAAYASLMRGLKELDLQGPCVPSDLVLIGDHAFPLAMNSRGQVLMAASLYGSGRIVVLGHEGYLKAFPALVENALTWLRGDGSDNLSVGVHRNVSAAANSLKKSSFQVEVVGAFSDRLGVGVYVTDAYSVGSDPKDLVAFLKAGGGVLIAGQAWNWADDLEFLLQGVSEFNLPSEYLCSEVLVHSPLAFPIGTTEDGRPFLAGAYYGRGRVIAVTHEGCLKFEVYTGKTTFKFKKTLTLMRNAIHWLDEGRKGVVGVMVDPALKVLSESGLKCEKTNFRKDLSVFVCTAYITEHLEEIQNFVAEGGGLLIGGHILNLMGLSLLKATISAGSYKATIPSEAIKDTYHFRHLLYRFAAHVTTGGKLNNHEEGCLKKLGSDCNVYLQMKAHDCFHYRQVLAALTDVLKRSGLPQVSGRSCSISYSTLQLSTT
uniref:TRPM8 channel-associated factor homolog n=1 Tax=Pundamilia nyererei TaxID=303518 RepID=A0A3B4GXP4_9CICH